jgi:2-dehydropantoate 2-reductase
LRFIIYGAGGIGGAIGGRLSQHGHDVILIARGDHYAALASHGLRLESPEGSVTLAIPVVDDPAAISFDSDDDVVFLTMKSQDTVGAVRELAAVAPVTTPVVCAQNGVENERVALRTFENVYGMCVMCPVTHLTPGVVRASSSPITGLLDVGRWPSGVDERAEKIAQALNASSFDSVARHDVARWKWGKLLMNLGNAVEAVCGPESRGGPLAQRAREEGVAVLQAAGIAFVDRDEDATRRGTLLSVRLFAGNDRGGGSSWQSLQRGTGTIETDYLSGEMVLQGRLAGVATPVNSLLQRLANQLARERRAPGYWSEDDVTAMLDGA